MPATLEEAASYVGLNARSFARMVSRREVPTVLDRSRRRRMVHRPTLDFWIEQHRVTPGSLAHLDSNRWPRKGRAS